MHVVPRRNFETESKNEPRFVYCKMRNRDKEMIYLVKKRSDEGSLPRHPDDILRRSSEHELIFKDPLLPSEEEYSATPFKWLNEKNVKEYATTNVEAIPSLPSLEEFF